MTIFQIIRIGRAAAQTQKLTIARTFCNNKRQKDTTPLIVSNSSNGVLTLRMNRPKRLNAWTGPMMNSLFDNLEQASHDNDVQALVLTGSGRYYCAGVDLGSTLKPMMPSTLHKLIVKQNQQLFDMFLDFPKPLFVAVNGPAVGASVTSATLTDGIIAVENSTFSTPFSSLGICPEGCSSVYFAELMGPETAERMLGSEGWKPTASEWHALGVVHHIVATSNASSDPNAQLNDNEEAVMKAAQDVAERWVQAGKGKRISEIKRNQLKDVNARESLELANCFLDYPFLEGQYQFAKAKKKPQVANLFWTLKKTRPLWSLFV
jgi:enoyl-CoA hydratase/carnithine racemase